MYIIKSYLHGKFLESYECNSLEGGKKMVKDLKYNSMGPFSFKIFKDDEEVAFLVFLAGWFIVCTFFFFYFLQAEISVQIL